MGCVQSTPVTALSPADVQKIYHAEVPPSEYVAACDAATDVSDLLRQIDVESSDGESTAEPTELGIRLRIKWKVATASLMFDINDDPDQFPADDETPAGRFWEKKSKRIVNWIDSVNTDSVVEPTQLEDSTRTFLSVLSPRTACSDMPTVATAASFSNLFDLAKEE